MESKYSAGLACDILESITTSDSFVKFIKSYMMVQESEAELATVMETVKACVPEDVISVLEDTINTVTAAYIDASIIYGMHSIQALLTAADHIEQINNEYLRKRSGNEQ